MIGMFLSTRTMGWCPQKEKMVKNRHYDVPAWRAGCRIPRHGHQRVWPHGAAWGGVWEGGHPQCPHLGAILMEKVCLHPWAPTTNSSGAGCVRPWIALQKVGHEWKWSAVNPTHGPQTWGHLGLAPPAPGYAGKQAGEALKERRMPRCWGQEWWYISQCRTPQGRKRSGVVMHLTLENKTEKMRTHRCTARWAVWRAQLGQDLLLRGE